MTPALLGGARDLEDRSTRAFSLIGMLRPGATREEAQAELTTTMAQLARDYPEASAGIGGEILSFWEAPRGPQRLLISGLAILQGVMLLLLLAVCGNTANLMLARGSTRQREMAVRVALGAGRWRIVSLVLSENMLLALLGAGLGAAFAVWGTTALRIAPMIGAFPILFQTRVDEFTLAFAILLGVACGLIFSAAPAVHLARLDPQDGLRSGSNTPPRSRARKVLMGVEVGLAMVVLIAAALFLQSFRSARQTDPRFRPEGVLAGRLRLKRTESRRRVRARICRAPAGTSAILAGRRGRRHRHECSAGLAWNSSAVFHGARPRAHGGGAG